MEIKQKRLPAGYQEVEYLESTGTQYIDANYIPSIGDAARLGVFCDNQHESCPLSSGDSDYQFIFLFTPKTSYFKYFTTGAATRIPRELLNAIDIIITHDGTLTINGQNYSTEVDKPKSPTNSPIILFARTNFTKFMYGKMFYFKMKNVSQQEVLDFVPCVRIADNKPGLYDICGSICPLTGTPFYINAGTGEFIAGPDVITTDAITIPEGDVKRITDSNGRILWVRQPEYLE